MKDFNRIGEDLFNKLRGRFQEMTIGDDEGNVTNEPTAARFFDFEYSESGSKLGKVSVSIDEDDGLTVIYSRDFIQNEDEMTQKNWYNFLRELRKFSKKRLLNFDVRDINKTNLTKRDYKFLATNRPEDITMTESKLYGTGRISYQNIDNARLVIKHTESIDQTNPSARTRKIGSIYIESAAGERFKYPYKHMSGARAMARHVAEGGNPYDDFGSHITSLSEEMSKLRKFKNYMGRSSVMAESLEGYMDIVKERISTVKKTIENLQKPNYYRETFDSFETPIFEDVPEDVAENWVDQLTIRQFNEELQDIFPYIYNLVKEGTKSKSLGPEDLLGEAAGCPCNEPPGGKCTCPKDCPDCNCNESVKEDNDPCWKNYKQVGMKTKNGKKVPNCVPEEIQLEQGFEEMMGQFSEDEKVRGGAMYVKFAAKNSSERDEKGKVKQYLIGFAAFRPSPNDVTLKTSERQIMNISNYKDIAQFVKDLRNEETFLKAKQIIIYRTSTGLEKKFPALRKFYDFMETYRGNDIVIEKSPTYGVVPGSDDPNNDIDALMVRVAGEPEDIKIGIGSFRLTKGDEIMIGSQGVVTTAEFVERPAIVTDVIKRKKKSREPEYDQQKHKELKAPPKKMTRAFTISNQKLFSYLRKTKLDFMQQYFKPNIGDRGGFVMNDKAFKDFEKYIKSPKVVERFGETVIFIDNENSFSENKLKSNKTQKTPLGEFILSYFDRESGQFPKGETAILTMVEKDYGEEFIEPAKAFIEQVNNKVAEVMGFREPVVQELGDISRLAGLR